MKLAEVLINRPSKKLDRTFTYQIPPTWEEIDVGWRVIVPFAGGWEEGIVCEIGSDIPSYEVKEIHSPIGTEAWFTAEMMSLAKMIADYYLCTRLTALRLFMLTTIPIRMKSGYRLTAQGKQVYPTLSAWPQAIDYWQRYVRPEDMNKAILERAKVPTLSLPFPVVSMFQAADGVTEDMLQRRRRQHELYLFLQEHGAQSASALVDAGFSGTLRREAEKNGLIVRREQSFTAPSPAPVMPARVKLTEDQSHALRAISAAQQEEKNEVFLLHGVTGSGKTEVYIRAAETAIQHGKSVVILVPEIALTPQMVARFSAYFGDTVIYAHSGISPSTRYANWWRIRHGEAKVVVGARSALFLPYQKLGLIVLDEEYDSSYKQEDGARYHARRLAEELGRLHRAPVVLGAATPTVSTYYRAKRGDISLLEMPSRIGHIPLPNMTIADMRQELAIGNHSILSHPLYAELQHVLSEGKQAILLLNRRGYATYMLCRQCGYIAHCPACERRLTYHLDGHRLRCHRCERNYPVPHLCPQCHSRYIKFMGLGTQKAEKLLCEQFPQAKIIRLDHDTMGNQEKLSSMLRAFHAGEGDILLGTQLVAKGHDLPHVRTVGILSIDNILNLPDYTAAERAFALVTQAAGRAGRKDIRGQVVLQTYHPDHYAIRHARTHHYQGFYQEEIQYRKMLSYPPFVQMMRITFFDSVYEDALAHADRCMHQLEKMVDSLNDDIELIGPYDEYVRKLRDRFFVSILIKAADLTGLKECIRNHPEWADNGIIIDTEVI